ncbi:HK97 family phage portal protein [Erythrobacter lutimaris]|nr:HK97 family phage portal protein [Alteriqipengyuania lutimaris]
MSLVKPDGWLPEISIASGERVTADSVVGLAAAWACVNFWAGNIAALPLTIYRRGADGVPVEDRRHPLFELLHTRPNFDQSAFDFWEFMVASLELRGNAFAFLDRRQSGILRSLTPIRPDIVTVKRLDTGALEYRWTDERGVAQRRAQEEVLHIRGALGGPLGGAAPLTVLRQTFGTALATERAAGATFENGARPSGILTKDGEPLTKEQRAVLEDRLQQRFQGAMKAGRPMLLDGGLSWSQLSMNAADAEMLESRYFSVEEVGRAFEVDPHLIGHVHGNTTLGSSISDQTLSLMKFKMRKRLKRIEGALEHQLLTASDRAAGVSIEFNVEGFLRADSAGRAEFYDKMRPFMTTNEVRRLEGLPPIEGGDTIMAQMQDVPLSRAVEGDDGRA